MCNKNITGVPIVDSNNKLRNITWRRITNLEYLEGIVKVRINHIGEIVKVGEE